MGLHPATKGHTYILTPFPRESELQLINFWITKHSDHSKRSNLSERCLEFACWNLTSHAHVPRETQSCLSESSLGLQDEVKNSAADFAALVQLTEVDSCPILDPRSPKVEFTQPACWEVRVTPSSEPLPLRHQLNIHSITSAGLQKP